MNIKGEDITLKDKIDYCFSLGVIHHTPNANKVCKKIYKSLKKNGMFICWLYGYEGNEIYIFIFNNLRRITILLPDFVLRIISFLLNLTTYVYQFLCEFINLPLNQRIIDILISQRDFKINKIKNHLGFEPHTKLYNGLKDVLDNR